MFSSVYVDTYDQESFIHIYIIFCVCGCVENNNSPDFTGKNGVRDPLSVRTHEGIKYNVDMDTPQLDDK